MPKKDKEEKEDKKEALIDIEKNEQEKQMTMEQIITLKDIDIKIKKGEFTCIIGDVGSGKSTLLSTLIGDLLYVSPKVIQKYCGPMGL